MASHPGPAWTRLGELLMRRRVELDPRYRNRRIFTAERAVEYRIVNDIELGRRQNYEPGTIAALEAAYAVTAGSIGRALEGGNLEPQSAPGPHLTAVPPLPAAGPAERGTVTFPELRPEWRPEAVRRFWDYEARIVTAAMEAAAARGIPVDQALAELPDVTAVFPEPDRGQERAWWNVILSRGLPSGRPYTYQELAHNLAALRVLWDRAETGQSSAGAGLAAAARLPAGGRD